MINLATFAAPDAFLAPRLMEEMQPAMPVSGLMAEAASGSLVAVAGTVPLLCHRAALPQDGLAAMCDCGISVPSEVETYDCRAEYLGIVQRRMTEGQRAWFTLPQPEGLFQVGTEVVDTALLAWLNDKYNLSKLVPAENLVARRLVEGTAEITEALNALKPPIVLKNAETPASSGGKGVLVLRARRHTAVARKQFATCQRMVIENYINPLRNFCVQFGILPDGTVQFLGATEQICSRRGTYKGNLIDPEVRPLDTTVTLGRRIAEAGAGLGFRGVAGFDILEDAAGRSVAVDLNFRPNASTPFLMLYQDLCAKRKMRVARFAFCFAQGPLALLLLRLRPALEMGWLVPTSLFDPALAGAPELPIQLCAMVMAESRAELRHRMLHLQRAGVSISSPRSGMVERLCRAVQRLGRRATEVRA
jgi:hypothetical protein